MEFNSSSNNLKKTIYVLSPFRLEECLNNWKAFYAMELFSVFALSGRRVVWIQPGKRFSFNIFPHFRKIWKFTVVELGNFLLFRYLAKFFISRLIKVSREDKPLVFFELVDGSPLNFDVESEILIFPIVFKLEERWRIIEAPPTPLFFVKSRGLEYLEYTDKNSQIVPLPWGIWKDLKESSKRWDYIFSGIEEEPKILFIEKGELEERMRKVFDEEDVNMNLRGKPFPVKSIKLDDLSTIEKILISDLFACIARREKKYKVILGKELGYLVHQLLFWGFEVCCYEEDVANTNPFIVYDNLSDECVEEVGNYLKYGVKYMKKGKLMLCWKDRDIIDRFFNGKNLVLWDEIVTTILEPRVFSKLRE